MASELAVAACLTKPVTAQRLLREIGRVGRVQDILVMDDDRGFVQLISRILEASTLSYQMRRAYDGREGLAAMHARRPDLLLLDLVMPDIDGFQVLSEMRQEPELATVPVILLTATSYAEDAVAQRGNQLVVQRADGLLTVEILRCTRAVIEVLRPHYHGLEFAGDKERASSGMS